MSSIAGAAIGAVGNLFGGMVQATNSQFQQRRQMQHDKDMAAVNQKNILAQMAQANEYNVQNMELQNQYQVDQWNRENAYNDPSAVRARYEAAGISPQAAFGNGAASDAGIAGGLSSAPSGGSPSGGSTGHSSNIMANPFGGLSGLGTSAVQGAALAAQAELSREKAESEHFDRTFIKPSIAKLQSALADKGVSDAEIAKIESQWRPYLISLESELKEGAINKQLQDINESVQRVMQSKAVTALAEEQQKAVAQSINESLDRMKTNAVERCYTKALISTESHKQLNIDADTALKEAERGHTEKLKTLVDKRVEQIGKDMELTDAQISKWKHEIAQEWSRVGLDAVGEVREWLKPQNGKSNKNNFILKVLMSLLFKK